MSDRIYFDTTLIDDSMLKTYVTETHIKKSTNYIEDLATSLGVAIANIANPTPFKIAELAEAYALMETAKKKSMMNTNGQIEGADAFELKRRVYAKQVDSLTNQITATTFTGPLVDAHGNAITSLSFPISMVIRRG
ncbi:MAG: hypothetical protein H6Q70_515 [Firmicutes bacterium]|nr:hypothetical protein [Bacillota bacterium]